jgi:pimeloyl-ACP methyl ester carboxylesterase
VTFELTARIDTDPDEWRLDDAAERMDSALTVHPHEVFGHGSLGALLRQMVLFNAAGTVAAFDVGATGLEVNPDRDDWIFGDFDRIFAVARDELGLEADGYDLFGHSAGGQILHRLALFRPGSKARRILAANSGWYTLPETETDFPYGLGGTPVGEEGLARALAGELVVFLGEEDDAEETRGSLRSTPEADRQGPGRLSRGRYFFRKAEEAADRLGVDLGWKLHVVPGVGHDHERMSEAAAEYLYGGGTSPARGGGGR